MPSFDDVSCARIPRDALARLASLRCEVGLQASLTQQHAWLRWDAGNERVVRAVLPIHDAELFCSQRGCWHRWGASLPVFDFPSDLEYQPLAHVLFPGPAQPIAAPAITWQPMRLTLQRDDRPRATTALLAPLASVLAWSDTVPAARLASLEGVALGGMILILGAKAPPAPGSERFWGQDVLIPLGFAPELALPESALKEAAGLQPDEILLWKQDRADVIARSLAAPLTRAGLRLSAREARI